MADFKNTNIDKNGNVLFLDEDRLKRKERPDKPMYKIHRKGLGITDFLIKHVISARPWNWGFILKEFLVIVAGTKAFLGSDNFFGKIWGRVTRFEPDEKAYTHGTLLPLDIDVSEDGKNAVLPIDLIKDIINKSDYIASMNRCICRDAYHFDEVPEDVCCLLFSKMAHVLVGNGTAYEITKEEALARVDRAAELGLIGQAMWIEVEQLIWGLKNDEMDGFFEICFCHPTCCVAMNVVRYGNRKIKSRFNPSGWTAVADLDKCAGCGTCKENCVQKAIEIVDGKVQINQEYCYGCGVCKANCKEHAISIKQTMPMRNGIEEYFEKEGRLQLDYNGK